MANILKKVKNLGGGVINRTWQRLTGAGLRGGNSDSRLVHATAKWSGSSDKHDWRVKLTLPPVNVNLVPVTNVPVTEFVVTEFIENPPKEFAKVIADAGSALLAALIIVTISFVL